VSIHCKNLLSLVVLVPFCFGGVASNPFLRPGSNRPVPKAIPVTPPPKPAPNPAIANEVEFKGYFLLKGVPHFCIFNKKANVGEWIKLTEKTFEEFEAQAFDLASETLTLAFNGQDFTLTLEQTKSLPPQTLPSPALPKVKPPLGASSSSSSTPKVMPPKPRNAPKLPNWLTSRMTSRSKSSSPSSSIRNPLSESLSTSSSRIRIPPVRTFPYSSQATTDLSSPRTDETTFTSGTSNPGSNISDVAVEARSPSSLGTTGQSDIDGISDPDNQSDLDNLPPPPPPPNILPPSPPPDIIPSLDE
jgi:hypothetical protein